MNRVVLFAAVMNLVLAPGPAHGQHHGQHPLVTGNVDAVVSVVKGVGVKRDDPPQDISHDLDGSRVELGRWSCILHENRCTLTKVEPGAHVASAQLRTSAKEVGYRLLGTNAGYVVTVKPGAGKNLLLHPQNVPLLVYKVERYAGVHDAPPDGTADSGEVDAAKGTRIHSPLVLEFFVKVFDESEGGSHLRKAYESELDGIELTLGPWTCVSNGGTCLFRELRAGEYRLEFRTKTVGKIRLQLSPETRPYKIALDTWTRRPRVNGRKGAYPVIIEKTILR